MPPTESIEQIVSQVRRQLPELSRPQAKVLAEWGYGAQVLQRCGQSQVSEFLAQVLGQKVERVRQRLRTWTWARTAKKKGKHRQEVPVAACFASLLRWVLSGWPAGEQRVTLALDATSLKTDLVVLTVSVVLKDCAIPVAWQVLPAATPGAWRPYWLELLRQVQAGMPARWSVLVLADRGLYADWLFTEIVHLGWHPFLRINSQGLCCPDGTSQFQPLLALVPADGATWRGRVTCFKTTPVAATLLAIRAVGCVHPWLILTDLPPEQAEAHGYGQRAGIEAQFKDLKRGGWQWHLTRMTRPERVSRMWLVLAVSLLLSVSRGSQLEASRPVTKSRRWSVVTLGRLALLVGCILDLAPHLIQFAGPLTAAYVT